MPSSHFLLPTVYYCWCSLLIQVWRGAPELLLPHFSQASSARNSGGGSLQVCHSCSVPLGVPYWPRIRCREKENVYCYVQLSLAPYEAQLEWAEAKDLCSSLYLQIRWRQCQWQVGEGGNRRGGSELLSTAEKGEDAESLGQGWRGGFLPHIET